MRDCARYKGCHLRIARNHTGSIFMPNNDYWKRSREKILKSALLGGQGYKCAQLRVRKKVAVSVSCEIAGVGYLGQIMNIGSAHARKL